MITRFVTNTDAPIVDEELVPITNARLVIRLTDVYGKPITVRDSINNEIIT